MKKRSIIALLMVCCFILAFANPVSAEQPTDDDVLLVYNFDLQELTVEVRQCKQILCQLSENYVSKIIVYKVAVPTDILLEERDYPKQNVTWGMSDTFQVDAIEGEQIKVQVAMKNLEDSPWPILNKTLTLGESAYTIPIPSTIPDVPFTIPTDTIIQLGLIGGTILIVVFVADRRLFRHA
ncbi:MAG: hypothetical protein ACXACG_11450 [Candidatus Thorarchaeota archaeon]|jgi:hypothetical protein